MSKGKKEWKSKKKEKEKNVVWPNGTVQKVFVNTDLNWCLLNDFQQTKTTTFELAIIYSQTMTPCGCWFSIFDEPFAIDAHAHSFKQDPIHLQRKSAQRKQLSMHVHGIERNTIKFNSSVQFEVLFCHYMLMMQSTRANKTVKMLQKMF